MGSFIYPPVFKGGQPGLMPRSTYTDRLARSDGTYVTALGNFSGELAGGSVPATSSSAGDWYVINTAGTSQGITWAVGDIAIYEGTSGNWSQVAGTGWGVPQASQSDMDDGVADKYADPEVIHGYVDPLLAIRQPAPRIISDGVTTNRAIIGQFGAVGNVAGSAAIQHAVDRVTVPSSAPASNIILAAFAPAANADPITQAHAQILYIDTSGKLVLLENGATPATDYRKYTSDAAICTTALSGIKRIGAAVTGGSSTSPVFTMGGATIAATETTGAGTDPDWLDSSLDCTNHLTAYVADSGDVGIATYYNYGWSEADGKAWTGGGAMPVDAEQPAQVKYAADWSSTVDSWAINGSGSLSVASSELVITGGTSAKRNFADTPIGLTKFRVLSAFTVHPAIDLKYWNGSSFVNAIAGWDGSEQVVTITRSGTTLIWTLSGASAFNITVFESTPLGAIDDPIIQPGLTTGDRFGRFSRRLLGMRSVPNTDRGQIIINTAANADTLALGGPVFENTTDYVLEGPIEQVTKTGTPTTKIGHTSGGTAYKASGALAAGVNPITAVTRKIGGTSIYVGSDDTTAVRTIIPFRKISTPSA